LPLDDTDKALQLLIDNFPQLRIRMLTRYLVMVDAPASAPAKNKYLRRFVLAHLARQGS